MQGFLNEEQLSCFLKEYVDDRVKLALLGFWGRHPKAKFSRGVISCALDCKKTDLDRALKIMVEAGLVNTRVQSGMTFYSLTTDEERKRPVLHIASLGLDQLQLMVKRLRGMQAHEYILE